MTYSLIPLDGERLHALILDPVLTLGLLCDNIAAIEEIAGEIATASLGFYEEIAAESPWFSYLARRDDDRAIVGTCSFKGPPHQGIVEIAYFTFPGYEGQGCSTAMAQGLVHIARKSGLVSHIIAHTLPEESASSTVLRRNGFHHLGTLADPDHGDVWRWLLEIEN